MKKKITRVLLALLFLAAVFSVVPTAQAAVKLSAKKVVLLKGQTKTLKVKGTKKKVTWKTSKKAVATVSAKGKITAKKVGKATITAKVAGKTLKCTVIVDKNPGLDGDGVHTLEAGNTLTLKVTGCTSKPSVTWKSSNTAVATVSKGTITAKSPGKATISAKVLGKTCKYDITVTEAERATWKVTDTYSYIDPDGDYLGFRYYNTAWYAIVEVENTGNINLKLGDCVIEILNQNGVVMDTLSNDSYQPLYTFPEMIRPGEKGYFYGESGFNASNETDRYSVRVKKTDLRRIAYSIPKDPDIIGISGERETADNGKEYPSLTYTVKNNDIITLRDIQTGVIFYDASGHVVGVDGKDGSSRHFTLTPGSSSEHTKGGYYSLNPGCTTDKNLKFKIIARVVD